MLRLSEQEKQEILRIVEGNSFLLTTMASRRTHPEISAR